MTSFREHITQGNLKLVHIEKNEQQADIITKPLAKPKFEYLCKHIMGW